MQSDQWAAVSGSRSEPRGPAGAGVCLWPRIALAAALSAAVVLAGSANSGAEEAPRHSLQLAQTVPRIEVAPNIISEPASRTLLPIDVGPPDVLPKNSFLRLRGLPPAVSLTEGHAIAPGAWAVPVSALPDLHMNVPTGVSGRSELTISLVAEDGTLLAEAKTAFIVVPVPIAAPPPERKAPAPAPTASAGPPAAQAPNVAPGAPPAKPAAPVLSPADRENAEKLVARGERDLQDGNIAMARQFFLRAAEMGLARGALLLAATYDPRELSRLSVRGVQPNPALARKWYERAKELGAPEAEERLSRLGQDRS